jgi:hypothetical protein
MAGRAFGLSYKALATSQLPSISLKHGVLEIYENLPSPIQSEIESIYIQTQVQVIADATRDAENYNALLCGITGCLAPPVSLWANVWVCLAAPI